MYVIADISQSIKSNVMMTSLNFYASYFNFYSIDAL